jgi:hypothetical protein
MSLDDEWRRLARTSRARRAPEQWSVAQPPRHLWSVPDVSHADAILTRLRAGTMPCDGAWPAERIEAFERWIAAGTLP